MEQNVVKVDNGVRLMVHGTGSGAPAIVWVSSTGGVHSEWSDMIDRLSTHAQVITY